MHRWRTLKWFLFLLRHVSPGTVGLAINTRIRVGAPTRPCIRCSPCRQCPAYRGTGQNRGRSCSGNTIHCRSTGYTLYLDDGKRQNIESANRWHITWMIIDWIYLNELRSQARQLLMFSHLRIPFIQNYKLIRIWSSWDQILPAIYPVSATPITVITAINIIFMKNKSPCLSTGWGRIRTCEESIKFIDARIALCTDHIRFAHAREGSIAGILSGPECMTAARCRQPAASVTSHTYIIWFCGICYWTGEHQGGKCWK